ncbi:glycosyltransferase family 4 protein [Microbacterium sp. SL75]|uniref:glycosyltransferase family 4 protein n=1 Tax=Microbacterium sp. SL75 TaxID=2995140 RepID=UPI00227065BF|nr:glycosyltransferase family 4 protein [Microbacterium sp. SL75]WAC68506.1 glycosyltransferase family 4 protein [Microbacterium sp. SL75]
MSLHIALCGPASLDMLEGRLEGEARGALRHVGYPFPLLPTLAEAFLNRGHQVSLVTTSSDIDRVTRYEGRDVSVLLAPSRPRARDRALDMFAVERAGVARALSGIRADVVHAHWTYEFALGALKTRDRPTVITAHDAPFTVLRHMPDAYRFVRALMASMTRLKRPTLTAVSPYLAERWRREMFFQNPIDVIPNPVSASIHHSQGGAASVAGPVILSVSDSSRRKNVMTLLRAFLIVRSRYPNAELRLVGNGLGPDDEMARTWTRDSPASGVVFVGRRGRDDVASEYARATVFCHTSLEESQGLVLLEAVREGLPVVAGRDSGAVRWTLFDGAAGILTDVRSPQAVADALVLAISTPERASAEGFDGARMVEERFGADVIADIYLEKYRRTIAAAAA